MTASKKADKIDDNDLVARAIQELPYGTRAYESLMRRYFRLIGQTCQRMLRDPHEAEEARQDIMLKVFNALPRFEGRASFKTWLLRISTNTCITRIQKRKLEAARYVSDSEMPIQEFAGDAGEDPSTQPDNEFEALTSSLSSDELQLVTLRFVGDLGLGEIAEVMGIGLSATKMRYYRALEKLKAEQQQ